MKSTVTLLVLTGATLLAVLSAVAVHRQNTTRIPTGIQQTFSVNGKVLSIDAAANMVRIQHEKIPDYMPAMAMPFTVKEAKFLQGLHPGDSVRFQLAVTPEDSWIAHLAKLESGTAEDLSFAAKAATTVQTREAERIQAGQLAPDFSLTDQDGRAVRLSEYRGKAVLVAFIYTRCPIPNFCPLMSKNFASLQERLVKEFPGRVQLLSISIDPEFDQPPVLREYASRYSDDRSNWTFATGTAEQIDFVAGLLGLTYQPENGLISHDLRTALIAPDGKLVHVWKSNVWTPYEVHRQVRETLTGQRDIAAK